MTLRDVTERFVFVATTGRSGTHTLARICARIPGCASFQEPTPNMNGPVLQAAAAGDLEEVRRHYVAKSAAIRRAAAGSKYYVETNHQFIKVFAALAVEDFGDRLAVIHLQRPPLEVAASIFALGSWPGTESGNKWWLDPTAPTNLVQVSDVLRNDGPFAHPFYRALWYWHEIEARVDAFRQAYPRIPIATLKTDDLNDADRVSECLRKLGIACAAGAVASSCSPSDGCLLPKRVAPPHSRLSEQMHDAFRLLLHERSLDRRAKSSRLEQAS